MALLTRCFHRRDGSLHIIPTLITTSEQFVSSDILLGIPVKDFHPVQWLVESQTLSCFVAVETIINSDCVSRFGAQTIIKERKSKKKSKFAWCMKELFGVALNNLK